MTEELIEQFRTICKPVMMKLLKNENFEGMGEEDAADFEKDFDEILDLALKGLKETEDEGEIPADRDYADDNGVKKSDVLKHFGITPKELFKPGNFSSMPPKEDAWRKLSHFHEFEEQADPDKIVCIKFYYDAKFPRAYLSVCGLKVGYPEKT